MPEKKLPIPINNPESKERIVYPIEGPPTGKKCCPSSKSKGDRGFIEGCLFALCCCWLCEACF